jgi:hypothetical protein
VCERERERWQRERETRKSSNSGKRNALLEKRGRENIDSERFVL